MPVFPGLGKRALFLHIGISVAIMARKRRRPGCRNEEILLTRQQRAASRCQEKFLAIMMPNAQFKGKIIFTTEREGGIFYDYRVLHSFVAPGTAA